MIRRRPPRRALERDIQQQLRLAISQTCPDVVLWRNAAGVATRTDTGATQRFGLVQGAADLVGILTVHGVGVSLWIEVKSATGRVSREQALFRQLVEKYGAVYILARSPSEALAELQAARAKLRTRIIDARPVGLS